MDPLQFLEALKRGVAIDHLIEDAAQRPHIARFSHLQREREREREGKIEGEGEREQTEGDIERHSK